MKSVGKTLGWIMVIVLVLAGSATAQTRVWHDLRHCAGSIRLRPDGRDRLAHLGRCRRPDRFAAAFHQHGAFFTDRLKPGKYSLRVSVPGFLPAMERHVSVIDNLTTLLRVQVDSIFSSLDTLRRPSDVPAEPDDWKWVLRSSAATRTILQWRDADVDFANNAPVVDSPRTQRPRGLVQLTSGGVQPGSLRISPTPPPLPSRTTRASALSAAFCSLAK